MSDASAARYVFVDRDGVLNRDRPDSVRHPDQLEILPGVPRAIQMLNEAAYKVIVVTNQACVGRGATNSDMLDAIHERLVRRIGRVGGRIERIYVCPHVDENGCECRKPLPGLLLHAHQDYQMDLSRTWFVGDSPRDVHAARAAGCIPALVLTGKTTRETALPEVAVFTDLLDFAHHVTSTDADDVS